MKITLAFQIDQCGPGSFQAVPDYKRLKLLIESTRPLWNKYNVHFVIKPSYPEWEQTLALLDTIVGLDANYALDVFSSDNISMMIHTWHAPYDIQHGISKPIQNIISLKERHPNKFVALWFHELLCMHWMIVSGRAGKTDYWKPFSHLAPTVGNFYEPAYVYQFLSYAHSKQMPVYWSEPKWDADLNPAPTLSSYAYLYKDIIVPVYANNINTDAQINTYQQKLQPILPYSNKKSGLSNQTWRWDGTGHICPVDEFLQWTLRAIQAGVTVIRFEPGGALWDIPIVFEPYVNQTAQPSYLFNALSGALLT